jgi:hypothetical protein
MGVGRDEFVELAMEKIINELCYTCLQSLVSYEGRDVWLKDEPTVMYMIGKALSPAAGRKFDCSYKLNMPIIGIGAPIAAWLPKVAEKLHTELIIPRHAEVANAVGAAAGKIMETVKVLIKPAEKDGAYLMHAPWERRYFEDLQEAVAYALDDAKKHASMAALKAGAKEFELVVNHEDVYARGSLEDSDEVYIESRIEIAAVGRPEWAKEEKKEKFFVDLSGC